MMLAGTTVVAGLGASASAVESTVNDVRVGSFNVSGVNGDSRASGEHRTWRERRPVVVSQILATKLDVVGLQEANQSTIYKANLDYGDNQYMDLKGALNANGGNYALTNKYAYNCVNPKSTYNCVYQDRDAANDNRILYDTDTVSMVSQGAVKFATQTAGKNTRYLVWAIFRAKNTGKKFFFTTTHLDPYSIDTREAQWSELISKTNELKGSLPVVSVGDFNTSKFSDYAGPYLAAMKNNGYGDVVNQQFNSNVLAQPRSETLRRAWVGSFNGYRRDVASYGYEDDRTKIGNGIDWIFATNTVRVKAWEVVVTMNTTTLQVKGVIPSDHALVRATLVL